MKPLFFSIVIMFGAVTTVSAQETETSTRSHVFEFLKVVPNPRAAALGGSFVAMKNDPNVIFSNPAAMATLTPLDTAGTLTHQAGFGFTKHILDINEGYASILSPGDAIGIGGVIGAGVQYIDYGSFSESDALGQELGEFGARELALSIAHAGTVRSNIRYGVAVKFITSSLVSGATSASYGSSGIAADLGAFYEYEAQLMTFGIAALNIGTQLSHYAGEEGALPFNLQIGISKRLERLPLTLHLAFRNVTRDREGRGLFYALNDFSVGGEFVLGKTVRLLFGYENQKRRELRTVSGSGLSGFSIGTGLTFGKYRVDYALSTQAPAFAALHRIGATMGF